uniref:EF-hand domain-containing protein n=1 Tax=Guillardia theta TaxID=55529 RepID=A0A7S4JJ55_GUITH
MDLNVDYGNQSPEEEEYLKDKVKFSEEHPDEAVRIHLKRKAMRQAALRKEYEEKKAELLARLSETNRARNVVIAILTIIVLVTVLIDFTAHKIHAMSSHFSKPVIETLFKELTVLGCIALLVFMSVKTGLPQQISTAIFGTPSELVEMFDMAHILLFLIVVLFVTLVGCTLWRFKRYCDEWEKFELFAIQNAKTEKSISELFTSPEFEGVSREVKCYCVMRHSFLNPPLKISHKALDSSFRFSQYLKECTTETFNEMVQVEPETWGIILLLIVLARFFMMIPHEDVKIAVFLLLGILLLAIMIIMRNKLLDIYMMLVRYDGHIAEGTMVPFYISRAREDDRQSLTTAEEKGWFYKLCNGTRNPNPQERLFWFGISGPHVMMHIIRTCSFLGSVYFSLFVFRFGEDLVTRAAHTVTLLIMAILCPSIMMYYYLPQVMKLYVLVTSIEMMRRRKTVHTVEMEIKARRKFFVTRLLHTLRGYARRILKLEKLSRDAETSHLSEIKDVFEMFERECRERSGTRYIPRSDVQAFFHQIGMVIEDHEVEDLVLELGDGLNGILFEQTVDYLGGFSSEYLTDQMIDAIFVDIDRENKNPHKKFDNEITEDEFCTKLSQLNPFFDVNSPANGAEELLDWLDWAIINHKINVITKQEVYETEQGGQETHTTRVLTPLTFRSLIKLGSQA